MTARAPRLFELRLGLRLGQWLGVGLLSLCLTASGCGEGGGDDGGGGGSAPLPPAPSCAPGASGSSTVAAPELLVVLKDRWEEAWLASPAVADLDRDGTNEIIVPRANALDVWSPDGALKWRFDGGEGRIWSSPIVADFTGGPELEVAFAARGSIFLVSAAGAAMPGFPVGWEDEIRSLAAGDIDADGKLDLVAAPAHGGPSDVMSAWAADGSLIAGFPPNQAGTSGCEADGKCYLAGCYDQNAAVADLDGDGRHDIVVGHDNAYASIHKGSGEAFDASSIFPAKKTPGVRYLHDLALAQQGYADDEETALQAHFTNTAPAIADLDEDGSPEILLLASVQNAAQSKRELGVALWALHSDASRLKGWEEPFHAPDYLAGLWDFEGTNIVGATNQVTVADLDPTKPGPELVFAGFDGRIHGVSADRQPIFAVSYTTDPEVLTGGVVVGDLSGDGIPEIAFNTYSTGDGKGALFILDAGGKKLHEVPLPRRGAMPVPTLADVDGNGSVEIVVSLKDAEDKVESVLVYTVPGSEANCLLWPTGRGNLQRNGWVPSHE